MTRWVRILILLGLILPCQLFALPEVKEDFPRLANYFLHWTISDQESKELAKFDLVILDAEVQERSRPQLAQLRQLNPDIILLAYVPASEIRRDVATLSTIAPLRYKLGNDLPEHWYVKDSLGSRRSFWPGTWIVDVTGDWNSHLPKFVTDEILSTGLWDGVFYDNAWDDIVHFARGTPDLNQDGRTDNSAAARAEWQEGLQTIYTRTIALNPNKFVFENDGPVYAPYVHGVLLESFPRKGWWRHQEELKQVKSKAKDPAVAILNSNTFNSGERDDYGAMRFGLATALVSDAFYSFDFGDQDHGQTWWYDEYEVFLGEPVEPARQAAGVWQRGFEQGVALVNTGETSRNVVLPAEVETLRGTQDKIVNNGRITRQLTVGARDGMIVLRPLELIFGAAYENGLFARVFNARGESVRSGFFAFDRNEQSGTIIAKIDLDGDKKMEKIKVVNAVVQITFGDGRKTRLVPFGRGWQGEISIDFGDVNRDGIVELVVAQETNGAQVRVYRPNGTLLALPFYPFGPRFRNGAYAAVGDLNNDGFAEIVIGAGRGGGPQVRIFAGDGRLLSGGFFAYDPRFRGGVRVAVGDTDGDGNAEIITGPGVGGGPQVRLFSNKGRPLSPGFFAFDRASRLGVIPIMADVDGDGKNEILAITK